jgi:hypothetical protein
VQEFQVLRVLEPALRMKEQADSSSRVGKILFVIKKRERLHSGEFSGTRKLVVHGLGLGLGFIDFLHCLRAEMSLRCRQRFTERESCLLDHLTLFGTSCTLSFKRKGGWQAFLTQPYRIARSILHRCLCQFLGL